MESELVIGYWGLVSGMECVCRREIPGPADRGR